MSEEEKEKFDVVKARNDRERAELGLEEPESPVASPNKEAEEKREKAKKSLRERIEEERKRDIKKVLDAHFVLSVQLEVARRALVLASNSAETILQTLSKQRVYAEINLGMLLKLPDLSRKVNVARTVITLLSTTSKYHNKILSESIDTLASLDKNPFSGLKLGTISNDEKQRRCQVGWWDAHHPSGRAAGPEE